MSEVNDIINIYKWTKTQRDDLARVWKWLVVVHYPCDIHEERGDIVSKHRTYVGAGDSLKHNLRGGRYSIRCTEYVDALEDD